jgi:hypothetical protein
MAVVKKIDRFSWQNSTYPKTHLCVFPYSFSEREMGEHNILTKCSEKLGMWIQVGKYHKNSEF